MANEIFEDVIDTLKNILSQKTIVFIIIFIILTMLLVGAMSVVGYSAKALLSGDYIITQYANNGEIIKKWELEDTFVFRARIGNALRFEDEEGTKIVLVCDYRIEKK